ncbi:MAG: DMT family transporter [Planctomycetota bacterium]
MNSSEFPANASWIGPLGGLSAAVLYSLTNIALRVSADVDPYLVSAVKATPTVLVLGPFLAFVAIRGGRVLATRERFPQFLLASFLAQVVGNVGFQRALAHIGLAASVPITLGSIIIGGAVLGLWLLKEPVGKRKLFAMAMLIASVVVLSLTPGGGSDTAITPTDVLKGSFWAALSGFSYSFFGVTARQLLQNGVRASTTMFVSGSVGFIVLWSYSLLGLSAEAFEATTSRAWLFMSLAGVLNFAAFIGITVSLRLLPVVAVNLINASQVAMAAVAGVLIFDEPLTTSLILGILLTLSGLILLAGRDSTELKTEPDELVSASPSLDGEQIN